MKRFTRTFWGALRRVFPGCIAQSQAVAFNMFLAFFPMMLLVLGLLAGSQSLRNSLLDIVDHLQIVLPPGSAPIFTEFLTRPGAYAWQWISLGLGGTFLAGTQMMRLLIDGFRMAYGDARPARYWPHTLRALLLLLITIAPWLLTVQLFVFGKEMRDWMLHLSPVPEFVGALWSALYLVVSLFLALAVLSVVYRVGHPGAGGWPSVLPGAALAMLLWWVASSALGIYIRHVPYDAIYGGVAVAIGLMLWMQLTATIILIGAAYNAQCAAPRS